jgi:hypothetical protein
MWPGFTESSGVLVECEMVDAGPLEAIWEREGVLTLEGRKIQREVDTGRSREGVEERAHTRSRRVVGAGGGSGGWPRKRQQSSEHCLW